MENCFGQGHNFSGSQIFDANATDSDTGLHGQLEYSITDGLNGGIDFTMDLHTGHVYVGAELDRETRDLYILNLTVKDRALSEGDRRSTTMEVSNQRTNVRMPLGTRLNDKLLNCGAYVMLYRWLAFPWYSFRTLIFTIR